MYKLYSNQNSGHSYKVALMLELNAIPYEIIDINLSMRKAERDASFQAHSAFGEVPVLVSEKEALCQSNHILLHLAEDLRAMGGQTPFEQRKVREWLFWEANRIGFSVPNLRYYSRFFSSFPIDNRDFLMGRVIADMEVLSRNLQAKMYLVGNTLTIADLACCGYLFWLNEVGVDISDTPNVESWLDRIAATPRWCSPYTLLTPNAGMKSKQVSL